MSSASVKMGAAMGEEVEEPLDLLFDEGGLQGRHRAQGSAALRGRALAEVWHKLALGLATALRQRRRTHDANRTPFLHPWAGGPGEEVEHGVDPVRLATELQRSLPGRRRDGVCTTAAPAGSSA